MSSERFTRGVLVAIAIAVVVRLVGPLVWTTPSERRRDQENRAFEEQMRKDMERLRRFEQASNAVGTSSAQVALGRKFADSGDYGRAAPLFERAAEAGELTSASTLAGFYSSQRLPDPDHAQAFRWYSIACDDSMLSQPNSRTDDCRRRDEIAATLSAGDLARLKATLAEWRARFRK